MQVQKITLTSSNRRCDNPNAFLGYEGENQANKLVFEFTDGFKDGLGVLNLKRGEEVGYVSLEKVGQTYEFPVKNAILSKTGVIKFQVVITGNDGSVIKYDPFEMFVKDAIDADSEMPEDYPNWVDMANAKLAEVDGAIAKAEEVSNQLLQDKENGVFNGKDGEDGKDGVSPNVSTEQTTTGAKITITDANGTHTAEVLNGKDGKDGTLTFEELTEEQKATLKGEQGEKGADGFSPIANVTQIDDGAIISITDKKGTNTATVRNGKDGVDGEDGITPHIGENGNWWIGDIDTGKPASGSGGGLVELPIATAVTLGGIKVGEGLEITEDGVLNALGGASGGATETVLWEGKESTVGNTITLSDSIENYDYIIIETYHYDGTKIRVNPLSEIKVSTIKETGYNETTKYFSGITSNTEFVSQLNFFIISDTTIKYAGKYEKTVSNSSVTKILGIKLGGSSSSGDSTPVGNIISFMGTIAPDGYLTCDGAVLNVADYPKLASHFETQFGSKSYFGGDGETTFAVPDLRNEFLRGYGELSNEIGIHQDATEIPALYVSNYGKNIYCGGYELSKEGVIKYSNEDTLTTVSEMGTDSSKYGMASTPVNNPYTGVGYGDIGVNYTSRPTNVAVLYCIKY